MSSKKINRFKFATLVVMSLFVMCGNAYCSTGGVKGLPQGEEIIAKDSLIHPVSFNVPLEDRIVRFGLQLLGTPYVTAGSGKDGFDCSGFVYFVFQHFKIQVPRSSSQFQNFGKEIPIDKVRKGDILVFLSPTRNVIGHLGIVSNPNGKESDFIHASSGREMKVVITSLKKPGYSRRFVKAVRVL